MVRWCDGGGVRFSQMSGDLVQKMNCERGSGNVGVQRMKKMIFGLEMGQNAEIWHKNGVIW